MLVSKLQEKSHYLAYVSALLRPALRVQVCGEMQFQAVGSCISAALQFLLVLLQLIMVLY